MIYYSVLKLPSNHLSDIYKSLPVLNTIQFNTKGCIKISCLTLFQSKIVRYIVRKIHF